MALPFYALYSTNQYHSVSSTTYEATLYEYITLSRLPLPPLPYV